MNGPRLATNGAALGAELTRNGEWIQNEPFSASRPDDKPRNYEATTQGVRQADPVFPWLAVVASKLAKIEHSAWNDFSRGTAVL